VAQYNTSNQVTYSSLNSGAGLTNDAAGDVTFDGLNSYLYDAEGRICAVKNSVGSITGYVYDAAGIRVARLGLGALSCNFAPGGVAWNIHASWALGQGGEQVAEFNGAGTWQHSNVYAGKLLGTYDTKGLHFYLDDWLGTRRVQTNSLGQLEMTCQSLPYGNGQNCIATSLTTADNPTEQFFTGKERDPESGDDYFGARYYSSAAGRFLSPDWSAKEEPVPYAKLDDPQTLNLYEYVRNNPMTGVDADGHDWGDALAFAGGVLKGAASSVSFGLVGAPSANDSVASLSGQLTGSLAVTHISAVALDASGPVALGGLIAAPETGGTSLVVSGGAVAAAAISSATVFGGAKNASAVVLAMALKKPPTGRGAVPSDQRDPQRAFTRKQTQKMLDKQGGKCAECQEPKSLAEVDGHHIDRHADGGATNPDSNGAALCNQPGGCHDQIHKP